MVHFWPAKRCGGLELIWRLPRAKYVGSLRRQISWAFALSVFGAPELSPQVAGQTLSTVLKYPEDEDTVRQAGLASVVGRID